MCAITGHVGKPGTGLHPLRGQNNVQGASDAGLIPMMFPDYQRVDNAAAQEKFRAAWGRELDAQAGADGDGDRRQRAQGRRARDVHDGREPVPVGPERQQGPQGARRARVPRRAGHLPHRDGRVRRRRAARRRRSSRRTARTRTPTGACRSGARCSTRPARRGRTGRSSATSPTGSGCRCEYDSVSDVFDEMVALSPAYTGLEWDNLGPTGKLYPNPDPEHSDGTVVLFGESFATDDGKAHLVPAEWMPAKELPDEEFPFVLNTGRLLEHWHTGSMTRRSFALDAIQPQAMVFLGHEDAERLGHRGGRLRARDVAARLDRARREALAPRDARLLLHPVPLPRGGREPADDRRDRPVREDPRVQVLRRAGRAGERARASCRSRARRARERADGRAATAACPASRRGRGSSPGRR